jgi:beta-lactamase superfamily II metal-dependent hydrolase
MAKILTLLALLPALWPHVATERALQETTALDVIFLAVGQGDGIVLRSPEGKVVLVDAGPGPGIVQLLRHHGIDSIDLAISTHPHADHIGGMAEVIRQMPVRFYMDNGVPHTTSTYRDLLQTLERSDVTYLAPVTRRIELGGLILQVLPPPRDDALTHNNRSVGVLAEFGEFATPKLPSSTISSSWACPRSHCSRPHITEAATQSARVGSPSQSPKWW